MLETGYLGLDRLLLLVALHVIQDRGGREEPKGGREGRNPVLLACSSSRGRDSCLKPPRCAACHPRRLPQGRSPTPRRASSTPSSLITYHRHRAECAPDGVNVMVRCYGQWVIHLAVLSLTPRAVARWRYGTFVSFFDHQPSLQLLQRAGGLKHVGRDVYSMTMVRDISAKVAPRESIHCDIIGRMHDVPITGNTESSSG